ncbi:MAG: hypothetical protein FWG67_01015 [Defluviitaleaceae bacterium]|nr:hypothetical protein [Defluviitaleaceae bacterium]
MRKLGVVLAVLMFGFVLTACHHDEADSHDSYETDAITGPTSAFGGDADSLVEGLSTTGAWVFEFTDHMTLDGDLFVDGIFYVNHHGDDQTNRLQRKLVLYSSASDEDQTIVENFMLNARDVYLNSPHVRIVSGELNGVRGAINANTLYVNNNGLRLETVDINANVVFGTQAYLDSATAWISGEGEGGDLIEVALEDLINGAIIVAE